MGKPHPVALRECAVGLVEQNSTHIEAAQRLCVAIRFVGDMVRLKRETGLLAPKPQGKSGRGELTGGKGWLARRVVVQPDLGMLASPV
jgi:transposase